MPTLHPALAILRRACRDLGPYMLVELLLPGGTLVALLIYGYQRLRAAGGLPVDWRHAVGAPVVSMGMRLGAPAALSTIGSPHTRGCDGAACSGATR